MGQFSFNNGTSTKTLKIKVEGLMSVTDANNFIAQYKKNLSIINPSHYTLEFDCTDLAVSTKESVEKLENCFKLYKQSNFSKVIFKTGGNSILKIQLNRIAKNTGLASYQII